MSGLAYAMTRYKSRCCVCEGTVLKGDGIAISVDEFDLAVEGTMAVWAHQVCAKKRQIDLRDARNAHHLRGLARRKGLKYQEPKFEYAHPVRKPSKQLVSGRVVYSPRLVGGDASLVLMCGGLTRGLVDLALAGECDFESVASRSRDLIIALRQANPPVSDGSEKRAQGPELDDFVKGVLKRVTGESGLLLDGLPHDTDKEQAQLERAHELLPVTAYEAREHRFLSVVGAMRLRGLRIDEDELNRQLSFDDAPSVLSRTKDCLRDGRLHPTMDALQASGRLSVSNPAMTTFGRRGERLNARRVVIPEDGHVLLSVDLSQIEPRVVAALSQDAGLLDAFDSGVDFHSHVAKELFGGLEHRSLAKRFNNALLYGAGVDTLREVSGRSPHEVKRYVEEFAAQFPGWVQWRLDLAAQARAGKVLSNHHGRNLKVRRTRAHSAAPATVAQSCARDIFVDGVLRIHDRGLSKYLRLLIHDEVLLSVPAADYDVIAKEVQQCLTTRWAPETAARSVAIEAAVGTQPGVNWAAVYEGQ